MYECEGIPHLVLIDAKSGGVITLEGRAAVMAGVEAFPFTPEAVSAAKKKKCASLLVELKASSLSTSFAAAAAWLQAV